MQNSPCFEDPSKKTSPAVASTSDIHPSELEVPRQSVMGKVQNDFLPALDRTNLSDLPFPFSPTTAQRKRCWSVQADVVQHFRFFVTTVDRWPRLVSHPSEEEIRGLYVMSVQDRKFWTVCCWCDRSASRWWSKFCWGVCVATPWGTAVLQTSRQPFCSVVAIRAGGSRDLVPLIKGEGRCGFQVKGGAESGSSTPTCACRGKRGLCSRISSVLAIGYCGV